MRNISIKIHNTSELVQQIQVVTKDGTPTLIQAQKGVNYEFVDDVTGRALQHIVVKRQDKDLHLSFEENGQEADLIIENFYSFKDSALIGLAEEGQYYHYIPDTANLQDYVTQLNNGDIEGQALGGKGFAEPWWVSGGAEGSVFPFLLGLGLIGGVVAIEKNDDDHKISKALQDFQPEEDSVSLANVENLATNLSNNPELGYSLPEHIAKALDDSTVAGMNNPENLNTNTTPTYNVADENAVPVLDNDKDIVEVENTADTPVVATTADAVLDVAYALYDDVALPIIVETDTPVI